MLRRNYASLDLSALGSDDAAIHDATRALADIAVVDDDDATGQTDDDALGPPVAAMPPRAGTDVGFPMELLPASPSATATPLRSTQALPIPAPRSLPAIRPATNAPVLFGGSPAKPRAPCLWAAQAKLPADLSREAAAQTSLSSSTVLPSSSRGRLVLANAECLRVGSTGAARNVIQSV